jgi:hypothetical protein
MHILVISLTKNLTNVKLPDKCLARCDPRLKFTSFIRANFSVPLDGQKRVHSLVSLTTCSELVIFPEEKGNVHGTSKTDAQ